MPLADLQVQRVVGRRHFDRTAAKADLHGIVSHDGYEAIHQRQDRLPAGETAITGVRRIHGHRCVAQHRLRAGGNNVYVAAAGQGVAQGVELSLLFDVLHLQVRDGRAAAGTPVHHPPATVDQAAPVIVDKGGPHSALVAGVQRETQAGPVEGETQPLELLDDAGRAAALPIPAAFLKSLTAQVVAGEALGGQLPFHHVLQADTGVVVARQQQRGPALHAPPPPNNILDQVTESMAHVQLTGHVGRRRGDDKGLLCPVTLRRKKALRLPKFVYPGLDSARVKGLVHISQSWLVTGR